VADLLPQRGLPLIAGARRWSDRLLVLGAVLMCWGAAPTLHDRFALARSCLVQVYPTRKRPGGGYGGFIDCLARHTVRLLAIVIGSLRQTLIERAGGHWRTAGFVVFGVDGTKISVPRTDANLAAFEVASRTHAAPEMLLTCLFHLATRSLWSFRHDKSTGSERGLLQEMLPDLPGDSLVVADAGFVGWNTLAALIDAGHHFVIRAGANVRLITQLGCRVREHDGIVYLWPERRRNQNLPPIVLRRLLVRDRRGREMCLLSSVLEAARLGDATILKFYAARWGVEVAYRWLKGTLAGRKMLSTSPAHARVELDWTMIGLWMLTLLALSDRTIRHGLSLAAALRAVREAMTHRHRRHRGAPLAARLLSACSDGYRRRCPKSKRHWPRRARIHRCKLPSARTATPREIAKYQALLAIAA
jgi:hypothetical protein